MASDSDARQDGLRAEHTALLKAVSSAFDALFRARMMGVLVGRPNGCGSRRCPRTITMPRVDVKDAKKVRH